MANRRTLILIAAIDLVLAVAGDNPLRYDWLFFVGLVVMVVGRRLRPRPEEDEGPSYVDCPACGAINDRGATACGQCDAEIT